MVFGLQETPMPELPLIGSLFQFPGVPCPTRVVPDRGVSSEQNGHRRYLGGSSGKSNE